MFEDSFKTIQNYATYLDKVENLTFKLAGNDRYKPEVKLTKQEILVLSIDPKEAISKLLKAVETLENEFLKRDLLDCVVRKKNKWEEALSDKSLVKEYAEKQNEVTNIYRKVRGDSKEDNEKMEEIGKLIKEIAKIVKDPEFKFGMCPVNVADMKEQQDPKVFDSIVKESGVKNLSFKTHLFKKQTNALFGLEGFNKDYKRLYCKYFPSERSGIN